MRIKIFLFVFICSSSLTFAKDSLAEGEVSKWWLFLNDSRLNLLLEDAFRNNPDIRSLYATLNILKADIEAKNSVKSIQSGINVVSGYKTVESENETLVDDSSYHQLALSATKSLDVFGRQKALIRSAEILYRAGYDDVASFKLFLSKEIVLAWLRLKETGVARNIKSQILQLNEVIYSLMSERQSRGFVNSSDLISQRIVIDNLKIELNSISESEALEKTILISLTGTENIPFAETEHFTLPAEIEINQNLDNMIKAHPDLLSVTKKIDAARKQLKYYDKKYYPDLSLKSSLSFSSEELSSLLDEWQADLSVNLSQLISDGGSSNALREKTYASLEGYNAEYKEAYLNLYKNLTDAVTGEKIKRENLAFLLLQRDDLFLILKNKRARFSQGMENMIAPIKAEISCLENELSRESVIKQILNERVVFYISAAGNQ